MSDLPGLLWGTIVLRPYVFTFLAVYLVAGCAHIGWKRTLAYIPLGYLLAWVSEYSSINWGFPYGDYFYIDTTSDRELWVFGVPFMDSLSYVFLSYCSYSLAVFLMSPAAIESRGLRVMETPSIRRSPGVLLLGAFLFVMLDVIIDPVALQGHRLFLGQIYGYKSQGYYFGIPMSNFGGWLLVGLVLMAAQQFLDTRGRLDVRAARSRGPASWMRLLGPVLYFSVLGFDIFMTFYIGEILLGIVGLLITASLLVPMLFFSLYKLSRAPHADFPGHLAEPARGHLK
ncbi:MAG: carotenoid biosynthesis protein [Desulfobacteraceae bacterium]|nr:carotenoid biosynthesis protein [Desulfobacteraceae bacterium]